MRKYVEFLTGSPFVHFSYHELPDDFEVQYDPAVITLVEVTKLPEIPKQGDYYDGVDFILVDHMPGSLDKTTLTADGIDTCVLSELVSECKVSVDKIDYIVTDGVFEFSTDLPGVYKIRVEAFPYLPKEWEVTAI